MGPKSQGYLPLVECASLLGTDFRQEKSIRGLTKGLSCNERVDLDSATLRDSNQGPCSPVLFLAPLTRLAMPSASFLCLCFRTCMHCCSPRLGPRGLRSLQHPTLPGFDRHSLGPPLVRKLLFNMAGDDVVGKRKNPCLQFAIPSSQNMHAAGQCPVLRVPETAAATGSDSAGSCGAEDLTFATRGEGCFPSYREGILPGPASPTQ